MAQSFLYVGTSDRGLTKEVEISVPWGIVAGKTLGDPKNPPVLCIHGWLDNCNTFDKLIPLLPLNRFYVFIDLPGHGLSSAIPVGFFYTIHDSIALVERITQYFNWKSFSLLSHSLGAIISAVYSGTFPEKVDKLILVDAIGIRIMTSGLERKRLRSSIESYINHEKIDKPPPTYSYDEAKRKLLSANISLNEEAADILLQRGAAQTEDGSYEFVRDYRHAYRNPIAVPTSTGVHFLKNIQAETMHLIAKEGIHQSYPENAYKIAVNLMEHAFSSCQFHSHVKVEGEHHVHLCQCENVIDHIKSMLQRPPRSGLGQFMQVPRSLL